MDLLEALERYYDLVPRTAADAEEIGPFTLFVRRGEGWPFYARPSPGATRFTAADVGRVRERQRTLQIPESFEWVGELAPGLASAARDAGLEVGEHPVLALGELLTPPPPAGVTLRLVDPDPTALGLVASVVQAAFRGSDDVEPSGVADVLADDVRAGRARHAAAYDAGTGACLGGGTHSPRQVDGTGVTEIAGVAVAPRARRCGIGAALTALLARDALDGGCRTVFLSAADDAAAGVYRSVGFTTVGTACIAAPPEPA